MFTGEQFSNELKRVGGNVAHYRWGRSGMSVHVFSFNKVLSVMFLW